jgi:hypothetical protein
VNSIVSGWHETCPKTRAPRAWAAAQSASWPGPRSGKASFWNTEEKTAVRFRLAANGNVLETNHREKSLIQLTRNVRRSGK